MKLLFENWRGYLEEDQYIDEGSEDFAALAPPYDKATYADKIAGATKNKVDESYLEEDEYLDENDYLIEEDYIDEQDKQDKKPYRVRQPGPLGLGPNPQKKLGPGDYAPLGPMTDTTGDFGQANPQYYADILGGAGMGTEEFASDLMNQGTRAARDVAQTAKGLAGPLVDAGLGVYDSFKNFFDPSPEVSGQTDPYGMTLPVGGDPATAGMSIDPRDVDDLAPSDSLSPEEKALANQSEIDQLKGFGSKFRKARELGMSTFKHKGKTFGTRLAKKKRFKPGPADGLAPTNIDPKMAIKLQALGNAAERRVAADDVRARERAIARQLGPGGVMGVAQDAKRRAMARRGAGTRPPMNENRRRSKKLKMKVKHLNKSEE